MRDTIDSIQAHIQETRKDLGANLQALEIKVKSIADWRQYLRTRPLVVMGALIGGIVFFAKALRGRPKQRGWLRPV